MAFVNLFPLVFNVIVSMKQLSTKSLMAITLAALATGSYHGTLPWDVPSISVRRALCLFGTGNLFAPRVKQSSFRNIKLIML